jgi:hypothetical protein
MNVMLTIFEYIFLDLFSTCIVGVFLLIINLAIYLLIRIIHQYKFHGKNILLLKVFMIRYFILHFIGILLSSVIMLIINNYISLDNIVYLMYNIHSKLFLINIISSLITYPLILYEYNKKSNRIMVIIIILISICIIYQHLFNIYFGRILLYAT